MESLATDAVHRRLLITFGMHNWACAVSVHEPLSLVGFSERRASDLELQIFEF